MEQTQADGSDSFEVESASQIESQEKNTDGTMSSLWMLISNTKDINKKIEMKKEEIRILKDIIIKQIENMQELQTKCEEANVILKQMPEFQQTAMERYEEALEITAVLQLKHCEINEILENAFKLHDNTLQLIESVKENFNSGREAGSQRQLVFDADIKEMKELGDRIRVELNKRIKDKESLLDIVEGNLGKFNCHQTNKEIAILNEKIENLQQIEEQENKGILLIKQQIQRAKEEGDYIKDCFDQDKNNLLQEKEKYGKLIRNEELLWNDCQLKIKESDRIINKLTENNDKMNRDILEEGNAIKSIKEEIIRKEIETEKLILQLNKMKINLPELPILTNMLQEKELLLNKLQEENKQFENNLRSNEDMFIKLESTKNNLKQKIEIEDKELNSQIEFNKKLQLSINQLNAEIETTNSRTMVNEKIMEQKQNEIINRINQIVKEDNEIVRQITALERDIENKKRNFEEMRKEISLGKLILEEKSNKVTQLEEEIQQEHLRLITEEQVCDVMCEQTNAEVEKLHTHCKTVKLIAHEIENEKMRFEKSKESYLEECKALNKMYNNKIDMKLKELEELKKQLSVEEEKYKDESSKIHFQYYTLKKEKKFLTGEMNYLQSVISRCNEEYENMDSYTDWITKRSASFLINNWEPDDDFRVQNVMVQPTVAVNGSQEGTKYCSSGSNSSLDLPVQEFITTKIATSKPTGKPLYQSSDSEPSAADSFTNIKRKPSFLEKSRGPSLKVLSVEPTVAVDCPQEETKYCSNGSSSSLDLPVQEFITTKIVTSKLSGKPLHQMPCMMDTSGVITLDSSDSEPSAAVTFTNTERKPSFLVNPRGPPLKTLSSIQKNVNKAKRLSKQTAQKTILDLVIDSS